jgi:cytochrome P450
VTPVIMPPTYGADIYTDSALAEPYEHYRAIRDAGPAVWLQHHDAYAIGRYAEARAVLADDSSYLSANGIALNEPANQAILGCTLASDGDLHARLRRVVAHRLTPRALNPLRDYIQTQAETLVDELVGRGSFDAVSDLARALPLSIVPDFVGWPLDGREHLLEWAGANFDSFGPLNDRGLAAMPLCGAMAGFAAETVQSGNVLPGSLAAGVLEAVGRGEVTPEQSMMLMLDYIAPSIDTTISAIGSAIWLFAEHPDQWQLVRDDPSLIPSAFNEIVRLECPIRAFGRRVGTATRIGDVDLDEGAQLLVIYASANRDERQWERPDVFDVTRDARAQLGFGYGVHACAGQSLARMETESILTALAGKVGGFELGEPTRALNNLIRAFGSLPVTVDTG